MQVRAWAVDSLLAGSQIGGRQIGQIGLTLLLGRCPIRPIAARRQSPNHVIQRDSLPCTLTYSPASSSCPPDPPDLENEWTVMPLRSPAPGSSAMYELRASK